MSEVPSNLHYTKSHEWLRIEGDVLVVGITDFAQDALTEVVWVDLAEVGTTVQAMGACASVESVKSVSEVNSPVEGEILESNTTLEDNPEIINEDPYGDGWIFKLQSTKVSDFEELLDAAEYTTLIGE
ncbi:MAG: glycine cleavage system protein GcvH [Candidatus Thermoplasmatota archaeon]|nr:glycine cleavage system protein GcvH [Candidatus Thermoplasmatota archaeon]